MKLSLKKAFDKVAAPFLRLRVRFPLVVFVLGRVATMVVLLLLLGLALFGLMALAPGDIVDQMMTQQLMSQMSATTAVQKQDSVVTQERMERLRRELGLDDPFYIQYAKWLKRVVINHDLGVSLISRAPVSFLIASRLANSVVLNLISLVFITFFSFVLGVYFSSKAGTKTDIAVTFIALFFHAFPGILLLILLQLFAVSTGLFPVTGYPDFSFSSAPTKFVFSYAHHIFLPLLAAFLGGAGGTLRMIRATMLDQLGQQYITSIRSRGVSEKRVFFAHAFRNTLNPYITGSSNLLASLFSGSLVTEIIFAYPGIGRLMYEAVLQQDINLVMADSMFISFLVLVGMCISDIVLAFVDPRIRYSA